MSRAYHLDLPISSHGRGEQVTTIGPQAPLGEYFFLLLKSAIDTILQLGQSIQRLDCWVNIHGRCRISGDSSHEPCGNELHGGYSVRETHFIMEALAMGKGWQCARTQSCARAE